MGSLLPVVTLLVVLALHVSDASLPTMHMGRPIGGFLRFRGFDHLSPEERALRIRDVKTGWFEQRLDHFNPLDTTIWKQLYYQSGDTSSGVMFVMISGESPADPSWNTGGAMADYAKKYNAFILQVEHRFYGESHPTKDMSVENLRYLSSEQALADLAAIVSAKRKEFSVHKVIVFGGSYSGNLAAWFRVKYPYLVDGTVSSSAPVLAQVDFTGYMEVVGQSLNTTKPPGACVANIAAAVSTFQQMMKTDSGRSKLKPMFDLCAVPEPSSNQDVANMYQTFANSFMAAVQYNNEGGHTIDDICKTMNDASIGSPIERYARVNFGTGSKGNVGCITVTYKSLVDILKHTAWNSVAAGFRPWVYQTCTEFGYYQSTDSTNQPFGQTIPIEYYTQQCADVFGSNLTRKFIDQSVAATNVNYGARNYTENKIVFINGGIDPWHALGIVHDLPQAHVIFIPSTAHCANMEPPRDDDPPKLKEARATISKLIGQWLQ